MTLAVIIAVSLMILTSFIITSQVQKENDLTAKIRHYEIEVDGYRQKIRRDIDLANEIIEANQRGDRDEVIKLAYLIKY